MANAHRAGVALNGVVDPRGILMDAKVYLSFLMRELDSVLYWLVVAVFAIGILTAQLVPPKLDVVAFAGLIFACIVLKPMVVTKQK